MKIGAMNHPGNPLMEELRWISAAAEFIDLTLEPPCAIVGSFDVGELRAVLERSALPVVGHTAFYLPLGSPYASLRSAAVEEIVRTFDVFAELGAAWVNVHGDGFAPHEPRRAVIERNIDSLRRLHESAARRDLGVMLENTPGSFNTPEQLEEVLGALPEVGLHLDIGHANLRVPESVAVRLIRAFGDRLRHVHLHDNRGGAADLHLPLGSGTVDVRQALRALKSVRYDGTITLEIFTPDRGYFEYSAGCLRRLWREEDAIDPTATRR